MSELKAYNGDVYIPVYGSIADAQVYLKPEADKVIAHHNYKRCVAMAKWCEIGAQFQHNIVMQFDNPFYIKRAEWLEKWHKRWLKLAEQFKEAK